MSITILCIDDSMVSRSFIKKGLKEVLDAHDLAIEEASNARDGLSLCSEKSYDFVTLDLTMPDMTGYDFLEAMREKAIEQNVIVCTADVQPLAEKTVMELGAKGYIEKPFNKDAMANILKKIGVL